MSSNNQSLSSNTILSLERVGLVSPLTNLVLDADVNNSSLLVTTGLNPSFYIDKFSNVGINTTNPTSQLEVSSNNGACIRLRHGVSSTAFASLFMSSTGNLSINTNAAGSRITSTASLSIDGSLSIGDITDAISSTNGGALNVAGGVAIAKSLFVGSNLTIGGNLFINGTTTTVNSESITIRDNTLILNSSPSGLHQSGLLINRFQTSNDTSLGSVITDTPKLITTVTAAGPSTVTLSEGSDIDNFYEGWWIKSGTQVRQVQSYIGSSKRITTTSTFMNVPILGSSVQLFNRTYSMFVWDETNKHFTAAYTSIDSSSNISIIDYANIHADSITGSTISANRINVTDLTDSTSSSDGSLIVSGGVGIAKNLQVGGGIYGNIQTASQPNITSLGDLTSLNLKHLSPTGSISQTFISNAFSLSIGVNGTSNSSNAGLAFVTYNSNDCILMNDLGNIAIGTNTFGYKLNVSGTINASDYYLDGSLLSLESLTFLETSIPGIATASSALVTNSSNEITGLNLIRSVSIGFGSATLNETHANYLIGITEGVAKAGAALIVDSLRNISGINTISASNVVINGNDLSSAINSIGFISNVTPGTASPNKALVLDSTGDVIGINSLSTKTIVINGSSISNEAVYISGSTPGTAAVSKVLVLNDSGAISGISFIGTNNLILGGETLTGTEAMYLTSIVPGTASAGKSLVLDSSRNITNINSLTTDNLVLGDISLSSVQAGYLTPLTVGIASPNKVLAIDMNKNISGINLISSSSLEGVLLTASQPNITSLGTLTELSLSGSISGVTTITANALTLGNNTLTGTEVGYLTNITTGIGSANKALVLDTNRNISQINGISLSGTYSNQSKTAKGQFIGAWNTISDTTFWGIGYDSGVNRVRIGICSDVSGTWNNSYATVVANNFVSVSDYRLKDNVKKIEYGLDSILKLQPVSYIMKSTQQQELGFLAHEVQEHIPEVVYGEKDQKENQVMNYISLIPILVKAIQDQNIIIDELRSRITNLER